MCLVLVKVVWQCLGITWRYSRGYRYGGLRVDIEKKMAEALIRVGCLEGVVAVHGDDDIAIQAGHLDDYLLVYDLGKLIERG